MLKRCTVLSNATDVNIITNKPVVLIKLFPFRFHLRLFSEEPGPEVVLKEENRQEVIENESLDAINKTEIQESPVIHGANMQEYMYMIPREKIQEKIKKHNIDRLVRSDFQKYQQGKAQGVLFKAMIASSIKMVMDRYNDQLQEKIEKLEKIEKKIKEQLQEKRDKCNDHLQEYALLSSILYGVWTLCEFLFLSVHVSFISNKTSLIPYLSHY